MQVLIWAHWKMHMTVASYEITGRLIFFQCDHMRSLEGVFDQKRYQHGTTFISRSIWCSYNDTVLAPGRVGSCFVLRRSHRTYVWIIMKILSWAYTIQSAIRQKKICFHFGNNWFLWWQFIESTDLSKWIFFLTLMRNWWPHISMNCTLEVWEGSFSGSQLFEANLFTFKENKM